MLVIIYPPTLPRHPQAFPAPRAAILRSWLDIACSYSSSLNRRLSRSSQSTSSIIQPRYFFSLKRRQLCSITVADRVLTRWYHVLVIGLFLLSTSTRPPRHPPTHGKIHLHQEGKASSRSSCSTRGNNYERKNMTPSFETCLTVQIMID